MKKAEKFLLEEAMDDLVLSCDSKGEYVYASDMMQKYADQQCAIQRVSQQRELLLSAICQFTKRNTQKGIQEVEKWIETDFRK